MYISIFIETVVNYLIIDDFSFKSGIISIIIFMYLNIIIMLHKL